MTPDLFLTAFVTLFVIIDPIGLVPLFVALTQGMSSAERRRVGFRAIAVGFFLLAAFGIAGESLL
ncbi:MAG: MarC family protein, partial [Rhodobacteraceae bacterium]|nr:MarC family protein [Paracoccaceae bacterium]